MMLFSKKNVMRLQLLENALLTIAQYFHRVKLIYGEITELDPKFVIEEAQMNRIIIDVLRPEYRSFVIVRQGCPTQLSLVEFENLLASQKFMAKQMGDIILKGVEEVLYKSESGSNNKQSTKRGYKNGEKERSHQRTAQSGRTQKNDNKSSQGKRFEGI